MDYSRESIDRHKKIQDMKDAGVICYANQFKSKTDIQEIRKNPESEYREVDILMENGAVKTFKTAGRIISSRGM
jgi:lysyl-tRNA synthetase class II